MPASIVDGWDGSLWSDNTVLAAGPIADQTGSGACAAADVAPRSAKPVAESQCASSQPGNHRRSERALASRSNTRHACFGRPRWSNSPSDSR